ncbi:MAG: acyl carrier protein [Candidatus Nanopelagicales bacterium]
MDTEGTTLTAVIELIGTTLGIEARAATFGAGTALFGELPELDSLGVVQLATALEGRFGFQIEDEEFTAEVFESVGSLADFVSAKVNQSR